jgi:hypothetical protein
MRLSSVAFRLSTHAASDGLAHSPGLVSGDEPDAVGNRANLNLTTPLDSHVNQQSTDRGISQCS